METTNLTLLRKDLFNKINNVIKYNNPINVQTKKGNVVILSEEDYNAFCETLYLMAQPEVMKKIKDSEDEDVHKMKAYNPKEPF